ncbi:hypothetical protein D3C87_1266500 [compost metagenome]
MIIFSMIKLITFSKSINTFSNAEFSNFDKPMPIQNASTNADMTSNSGGNSMVKYGLSVFVVSVMRSVLI